MFKEAFHRNDSNLAQDCMDKWKNLIDQWQKKYNKSGSIKVVLQAHLSQRELCSGDFMTDFLS